MNRFCNNKNREENNHLEILSNLDKVKLIQDTRSFNFTPVDPKKSMRILTRIIYLLHQGNIVFTTHEATEIFFAITKLFQSQNTLLRRLLYLCLKELSSLAQDVIIVTCSLTKDMTRTNGAHRSAAIRALCSITDSTLLPNIDRYLKQAIADKDPVVQSAALVSALHLTTSNPELARRWTNDVQEAITSSNAMVSYHALALVVQIRRDDLLSIAKIIARYGGIAARTPYTSCLLIRLAARLAEDDEISDPEQFISFIELCLHNRSEIVVYEAAHALVSLKKPPNELAQAVSILQSFCSSSKAALRLAATRTLDKLAKKYPNAVVSCTADLENLISDPNKAVATMAVTVLLTVGAAKSIDKIMRSMTNFMSEITDEFKIIVVQVTKSLCLKYPLKYKLLMDFLSNGLKDHGGLLYKTAIFEAMHCLIKSNPNAKVAGLDYLCEYVEDCEHTPLSIKILNVLGQEAPMTNQPLKYLRIIYNRVDLEVAPVRAAAVGAVARFAAARPELLPSTQCLLARCLLDEDDEVRDRAVFFNAILESGNINLINDYILNVPIPDVIEMEKLLAHHLKASPDEPFIFSNIPIDRNTMKELSEQNNEPFLCLHEKYVNQLKALPGFDKIGPIFKSVEASDLTEPGTEYRIRCVKHIFAKHLVLQFECLNTLRDHLLQEVQVHIKPSSGFKILKEVCCKQLPYNEKGNLYYLLSFPTCTRDAIGILGLTLEFTVKMCDAVTRMPLTEEGYADTYTLEHLVIGCSDQFKMSGPSPDWNSKWDKMSAYNESSETYVLGQMEIGDAAKMLCEHFGLPVTALVVSSESVCKVVDIRGGGVFRTGAPVLLRCRLVETRTQVNTQLVVRSTSYDASSVLLRTMQ